MVFPISFVGPGSVAEAAKGLAAVQTFLEFDVWGAGRGACIVR
jgi:hypothetical protein